MRTLTLLLATTTLALAPLAAEAGNKTIGLHTSPPVLTTGITAKPMIRFTTPVIAVPTAPPVVGEGGYDEGSPAGEGGYDPGTPGDDGEEEDDNPFRP